MDTLDNMLIPTRTKVEDSAVGMKLLESAETYGKFLLNGLRDRNFTTNSSRQSISKSHTLAGLKLSHQGIIVT